MLLKLFFNAQSTFSFCQIQSKRYYININNYFIKLLKLVKIKQSNKVNFFILVNKKWNFNYNINPFTAPACKISRLKSAHIHACKQYIWSPYNKNELSILCILTKIPSCVQAKSPLKSLNSGFKFGTFIGRFPSDGIASMAVKGLKYVHINFLEKIKDV